MEKSIQTVLFSCILLLCFTFFSCSSAVNNSATSPFTAASSESSITISGYVAEHFIEGASITLTGSYRFRENLRCTGR